MDERSYVEQKKASWEQLSDSIERIRKRGPGSLSRDQLSALGAQYRAVVSDLAFARSQGASRDLVAYLNDLAGRAHGVLYASRSARPRGAVLFIVREFPQLFRSTHQYTLVAALIFFAGWVAAAYMIRTGLVSPTLWAAPEAVEPATMSSFIMTNNIKVGIMAFAFGTTAGLLTIYVLFSNGLHIGAVASSISGETLRAFWEFVPAHGVIELTAIFICGGAGLMIGGALVAPGNMRRGDSLRLAAGKALRMFAGTLPFFVVAAIIEGFVSPSALPAWAKQAFAVLTGVALFIYLKYGGQAQPDRPLSIKDHMHP